MSVIHNKTYEVSFPELKLTFTFEARNEADAINQGFARLQEIANIITGGGFIHTECKLAGPR